MEPCRKENKIHDGTADSPDQNESANKEDDVPLGYPSKGDFSTLMKDQKETIGALGLEKYFPGHLTFEDVMQLTKEEKEKEVTLKNISFIILRNLIMLEYSGRDNILHALYRNKKKTKQMQIHNPIDIILSIFLCLNPSLKSIFCSKMFMCHMAIPLMFYSPVLKEKLHFWMWPLHAIVVNDGKEERRLVNSDQHVISFARLGRPNISKSKIANEILHETAFPTFFDYDCKLGSSKKRCSRGLLEAAWYLPSSKKNDTFNKLTMILNLRGDLKENEKQMDFLKSVSSVMVIVTDGTSSGKTYYDRHLKDSIPVVFLLDDDDDDDDDEDDDDDGDGNDPRRKRFSENPMVQYVYLKEFGQQISMAEIKESVLRKILSVINKDTNMLTIAQMCEKARGKNMEIDTDDCIGSKIKADKLFAMLKDEPLHHIKIRFTPLQTDLWKAYSDTEKELRNGSHLTLGEKDKLKNKMKNFRNKQVEKYRAISTHNAIEEFMIHLESLTEADLYFFLETLTLHLNDMKMKEITKYQEQFDKAFNNLKSNPEEKKQLKQREVHEAEHNLCNASFGVEHLFRELGQIFEAHFEDGNVDFNGKKIPKAVAKSIMLGYPFELMDGDVANIALPWVKAVFSELKTLIGDKKVMSLSILGLESSGKSTLLNAMFGLSFPVSVGRCTRGINMRLLPVQKGMFDFDYVMVVDTEGLRTNESDRKTYQRDNALATVVLGIADISIINIKGENTSEIKDILQICVHAFLRLKLANKNLNLRQSCIFIHQNVPAVNAKKQMGNAMKKLEEALDRITLEAAIEEHISDITRFSEIIKFDIDKHVWYFPDLWKGDPPMAPVNPGYSRSTNDVKNQILEQCSQIQTKYDNINECFVHLQDLWDGILANDFVFSFRNSLEMRSYNKLEGHFNGFVWELELFKIELCKVFGKKINQFEKYEDLLKYEKNLEAQTKAEFLEKGIQIKKRLKNLFEDGKHKSEFVQWESIKLIAWGNEFCRLEYALLQETASLLEHRSMDLDMKDSYDKNKREIVKKASELAEKKKGKECDESEMQRDFNKMWSSWISKWDIEEKYEDINEALKRILFKRFRSVKEQIGPEMKTFRKFRKQMGSRNLPCLANSFDTVDFESYIFVKASCWFFKNEKKKQRNQEVLNLINVIFREIDTKLQDLSQSDWKFNETEVKEMTVCIIKRIDEHNDGSKDFSISENCKIKLHIAVFCHCLPLFITLNKKYREKFSMKAKLMKQREIVWGHFSDTIQQKASDIVARNRFCDIIREHVEEYVRQQIPDLIYTSVIEEFSMSKHELCIAILTDLAEKEQFDLYIKYISDAFTYALRWIKQYIDKKCFEKPNLEYYRFSKMKTSQIVKKISQTANTNRNKSLEEWLNEFQNEIKKELHISPDSFYLVREKNVSDMEDFLTKLVQDLEQMSEDIKEIFSRDNPNSITWKGTTPYKKVMDKLWGCECVCPFCKEPCQWNYIHTGTPHTCIQHRSSGLSGWHGSKDEIIVIESCSFNIQSNNTFRCGSSGTLCKRDSNKCSISETADEFHPYKDYQKYIRDWNIHPCPDISSSKYWAWVMCKFNDDLAKHYGLKKAKIPSTWKSYSKEDAIKSLRET